MSIILRSIIFNILFFTETLFFSLLCLFVIPLPSKFTIKIARIWSFTTLQLLKYICKIKYEIKGLENLPKNKNFILASKHQSAWETIAYQYMFGPIVFLFKKELAYIPFFGLAILRCGGIPIDRGNGNKEMMKKLTYLFKKRLEKVNIIIFPEGTRTLPNAPLQYKSGLSVITQNLENQIVIPVAMNSGKFWPKKGFKKYPGTIKIHLLPGIETGVLPRDEFQEKLKSSIENEMKNL